MSSVDESDVVISNSDDLSGEYATATDELAIKRKRDEYDQELIENQDDKKIKTVQSSHTPTPSNNIYDNNLYGVAEAKANLSSMYSGETIGAAPGEEVHLVEVSAEKVGQVIGSKGAVIQEMQIKTGAKIYVDQNFPAGANRQVRITGTPYQVKAATEMVKKVIEFGPTAIHTNIMSGGPMVQQVMECTQDHVGRVIGSAGSVIKDIQFRSGAKIQIEQDFPEGVPRKINISGTQAAVGAAMLLVQHILDSPNSGPTQLPGTPTMYSGQYQNPYVAAGGSMGMSIGGVSQLKIIDVPRACVGRIIGRKGENVLVIAKTSGCKVQVDQDVPEGQPCKVKISGPANGIPIAESMVQQIVMNPNAASSFQTFGAGGMGMGVSTGAGNVNPMLNQMTNMSGMMNPYAAMQMGGYPMQMQQAAAQFANFNYSQMAGMTGGQAMGGMNPYGQQSGQTAMNNSNGFGYGGAYGGQQGQQPNLSNPSPASAMVGYGSAYGAVSGNNMRNGGSGIIASNKATTSGGSWTEHKTDDGHLYWFNAATGVSQWERPAGM